MPPEAESRAAVGKVEVAEVGRRFVRFSPRALALMPPGPEVANEVGDGRGEIVGGTRAPL